MSVAPARTQIPYPSSIVFEFPKRTRTVQDSVHTVSLSCASVLLVTKTKGYSEPRVTSRSNFAHARVVRRRSRRTSTDDDDSTSLPMVVDCSDTSLVGILHFHCEHCCLLCFLALVIDCDNNSCKDI